ncbi:MAG: CDP-alcohol phosphatidyltransferase family protein [Bacteroidales bacterium]|nr:CDP-alcohol phosphatidyltransferase family protein [Bacteroidales bacterium]
MEQQPKQAQRIQTSFINGVERKALIWLAERQPRWVTSDMLTLVGTFGALLVGAGFVLTHYAIGWLWLSVAGLCVNWYGDSLDGTLARVRNRQRPLYGYYLDHTIDCVNEALMFVGAGLSPLMHLDLALALFILYLFLTINVSINAHLKSEFRLTYAKLGPTEFRIIVAVMCILIISFPSWVTFGRPVTLVGHTVSLTSLDLLTLILVAALSLIYVCTIIGDARKYAKADPPKRDSGN